MKQVLIAFCICFLFVGCASKDKGYNIQGEIIGHGNSKIKLYEYTDSKLICIDSTISENGTFLFAGQVSVPSQHYMKIEGVDEYVKLFIENSEITIKIDPNDPSKPIVSGSSAEALYQSFIDENYQKHQKRINEVIDSLESLPQDINSYSRGELVLNPLYEKQKPFFKEFLLKNNNSPVSPLIVNDYAFTRLSIEENRMIYDNFTDIVKTTEEAKYLRTRIEKHERTAIGQPAPVFTMNDTLGNPVSIADFKGNFLFVDFWASWCSPCRAANKQLIEVHQKFKDYNFKILGVSFDDNKKAWIDAINKDSTSWTQVSELTGMNNQAKKLYDNTLPGSVLVNEKGIIIAKNLNHDELSEKLKELFEN